MEETSASPLNARPLFYPPSAMSVCNKYFYNLWAKYSRFRHWSPMGIRKRQFSVISPTACNAMTYVLRIISSSPRTLRKATQVASFCLKTRTFALHGWVVCAPQLHELSPKSGASALQNPHIRAIRHAICHSRTSKTRFSKVKISSRIRSFSARVRNVVGAVSHVATVAPCAWRAVRPRTHYAAGVHIIGEVSFNRTGRKSTANRVILFPFCLFFRKYQYLCSRTNRLDACKCTKPKRPCLSSRRAFLLVFKPADKEAEGG